MSTRIINVSNRLPVTVTESEIRKSSGGLVAALEGVSGDNYELKWIGWPGTDIADDARRADVARVLEVEHGCTPVFMTADEEAGFYEGYSNSSIWPLLHYMPNYFRYEPTWWEHYQRVNQRFADAVLSSARDGDLVWVHDYQLMLLPAILKRARPQLKIGFFLHTPFPSYEIFRCHPQRVELTDGLLGADLIGFHTFGYLRHFRSSVLRLLGVESEITRIRRDGRTTTMGVHPIGINARKFDDALNRPGLAGRVERFRRTFDDKRIVLSVERLDYTKGILHRLDAIDLFLSSHADDRDRIKFIFVDVPSRENVQEYQSLVAEVEARVGRLNGRYATLLNSPIHFIHGSVDFEDLAALYALADVAVVTPLIDGMNLVAKEYVACQRDEPGVLVLSEFAGAAEELFNALIVNPFDVPAVARCIAEALAMPPEEKRRRMAPMRERVMTYDAQWWARSFIEELSALPAPAANGSSKIEDAKHRLADAFAAGKRVALFLDYDGTLREIERDPAAAKPNDAVRQLLDALRGRPNVDVTIISGRTPKDLEAWFGGDSFGLIAEHGATLRPPNDREWQQLDRGGSYPWKDEIRKVLRLYEASTPGSFVEDKRTSLVWHYRNADPEFGMWKANQLVTELAAVTANAPVQVRHGRKIVEVTAQHINKGAAVQRILGDEKPYELVLVAGDDTTDESMFRLAAPNLIAIKLGEGDTQAQFVAQTPAAFRSLLLDALRGGGSKSPGS